MAEVPSPAHQARLLPHPKAAQQHDWHRDKAGNLGCRPNVSDRAVDESNDRYAEDEVQGPDNTALMLRLEDFN